MGDMGKKPISVPVFFTGDFPEGGATSARMRLLARGLKDAGASPELYILWGSGFNDSGLNSATHGIWNWIPWRYLSGSTKRPLGNWGKFKQTITAQRMMLKLVRQRNKEWKIIYCYAPDMHFFWPLFLAAFWFRIKVISEITEKKSAQYLEPGAKKSVFYYLSLFSEYWIPRISKHVLVISTRIEKNVKKSKSKVSIFPVMADTKRFQVSVSFDPFTFGYLGSFGIKDGIPWMLEAFAEVSNSYPDARLKLMGYCENYERISRRVLQLGLQGKVELTGPLKYDDIPFELASCGTLLLTRIDTEYAHFGFPTKLAEYLCVGRPVIASQVGDMELWVKHEKDIWLVPPGNFDALVFAMKQRLTEPEKWENMAKVGRETGKIKFDHLALTSEIYKLIERITLES